MRFLSVVAAAALFSFCSAAPRVQNTNHVLHEKRDGVPHEWHKRDRAAAHEKLPIRVGLRQRNLEHAEKFINDIADPTSPNFGKHWSAEKVADTFAPHPETKDAVLKWLVESGIARSRISFSTGRNWVQFDGTVDEAERLFATEYFYYKHKQSGGYRLACDSYSLPQHVQHHVDFIMPTVQLDGLKPVANLQPELVVDTFASGAQIGSQSCGTLITIECLRELYNFPASNTSAEGNEMGIAEWADYLFEPDLPIFFRNFTSPQIPADTRPEFISIDGGKTANASTVAQGSGIESALDFQSAYSIIFPQKLRLYQVGDGVNVDSVGTFNIFLDALDSSYCSAQGGDAPYVDPQYPDPNEGPAFLGKTQCGGAPKSNVFSFSYGQIEGALPYFYQQRQCNEWMKVGLQGVSVLFASGDSGVANRYNAGFPNSCLNADDLFVETNGTRYSPSFPVNCPFVTAVGGTTLNTADTSDGEKAVDRFGSGGGFANYFELPSYQATAVKSYMENFAPDYGPNVYNDTGNARGYPDVSAIGLNVATVFNGRTLGVGGTSASAPIFAGIVTLLNEARLEAGKGPLGFLNPIFYQHPEAFNDITIGNNAGCGTGGFTAVEGWDPVTGLGTPNFEKLKAIVLALP